MKRSVCFGMVICLFVVIVSLSTTCTDDLPADEHLFAEEFWGQWVALGEWSRVTCYISSQTIVFSGLGVSDYPNTYYDNDRITLKRQSLNILKMTRTYATVWGGDRKETWTFMASRIADGSFTGRVVQNSGSRSATGPRVVSGLGGVDVVVSNLKNSADKKKTKTDKNGNFTTKDIIPGDEYRIDAGNTAITATPNNKDDDIGNITTEGRVFLKAQINLENADTMELYINTPYIVNIRLSEYYYYRLLLYGKIDFDNPYHVDYADYQFTLPDGVTSDSRLSGTVDFSRELTYTIPLNINCDSIDGEYEYKTIGVTMTANEQTVEDTITLKFYQEKAVFRFYTYDYGYGSLTGGIIVPGYGRKFFLSNWDSPEDAPNPVIEVPKISGEDYIFILHPTTIIAGGEHQSRYNFAVNQDFTPVFDNLASDSAYNSEQNAKPIAPGDIVRSYLGTDETIFYKLRF